MASASAVTIETQLIELVRDLPPARAAEVLDFASFLHAREGEKGSDLHAALAEKPSQRRATRPQTHPAFGIWADRPDVNDPADFAAQLRRQIEDRRDAHG